MISFSSAIALDLVPRYHPCKPLTTTGTRIVTRVCQFKIDQIHQRTNFMWQENQPKGIFMKTFPPEHISEESIYLHWMSRVWHLQHLHDGARRRLVGLICCHSWRTGSHQLPPNRTKWSSIARTEANHRWVVLSQVRAWEIETHVSVRSQMTRGVADTILKLDLPCTKNRIFCPKRFDLPSFGR